jgi:hypothetical protein
VSLLLWKDLPIPVEDCARLHFEQWFAHHYFRTPFGYCPVCMKIPPFNHFVLDSVRERKDEVMEELQSWHQDLRPLPNEEQLAEHEAGNGAGLR